MRYVKLFFSYIFEAPEAKTPQNFRISGWSRPMLILHLSEMLKILDPHSIIQWFFFWLALRNWRYKLNTQRGHGLDVTKDLLSVRLRKEDF